MINKFLLLSSQEIYKIEFKLHIMMILIDIQIISRAFLFRDYSQILVMKLGYIFHYPSFLPIDKY